MNRLVPTLALLLAGLTLPAAAQERVQAKLYHKVEDDIVRVALEFRCDPGWHLYHHELGHPDAVGKPTSIELAAENVAFDGLLWPEPEREEQPDFGAWIWIHPGRFVVYAEGKVEGGAPGKPHATVDGLACDATGCIPYAAEVRSSGAGRDKIWAGWPSEEAEASGGPPSDAAADPAPAQDFGGGFGDFGGEPPRITAELFVREEGDAVRAALALHIAPDWHFYHRELGNPKAIELPGRVELQGQGVEWGEVVWPAPEKHTDVLGEWGYVHFGDVVLRAEGRRNGAVEGVRAKVTGQVCDEGGTCVQVDLEVAAAGRGDDALFAAAPTQGSGEGAGAGGSDNVGQRVALDGEDGKKGGLLALLLGAFFGGLFALMMPCTYPMIPITISFFTKQAEARGGKVARLALAYGAGIVLIFVGIGVLVGPVIIAFATHPVTNIVIGLFFLVFSLALFGVVELRPPQFVMAYAGKATTKGGYAGVFMMGATLVVTSFTCTAPFVGTLLGAGAQGGHSLVEIAFAMAIFGLTMAVPFVFLSMLPGRVHAIPRSGEWMNTLKISLGFVEVAAAFKFFSNAEYVWQWNALPRELFLLLWAAIFGVAAAYLFGWIKIKAEEGGTSSPGRLVGGLFFMTFALYCWFGSRGYPLDKIMTAIAPPYSAQGPVATAGVGGGGGTAAAPKGHAIVKDDYDAARQRALDEGKLLFVNFTGFT